jgi:hypothetical protein
MCEPLPRTINGGSPPTERNARTGEFTPPGIMLSARCCRRRDCSVLRDVVDAIESSRHGVSNQKEKNVTDRTNQPTTIAAPTNSNSSDIHRSAIPLQHRPSNVSPSSYPSNREGFEGQSRGLRTVLFAFAAFVGRTLLSDAFAVAFIPESKNETKSEAADKSVRPTAPLTPINSLSYNRPQ